MMVYNGKYHDFVDDLGVRYIRKPPLFFLWSLSHLVFKCLNPKFHSSELPGTNKKKKGGITHPQGELHHPWVTFELKTMSCFHRIYPRWCFPDKTADVSADVSRYGKLRSSQHDLAFLLTGNIWIWMDWFFHPIFFHEHILQYISYENILKTYWKHMKTYCFFWCPLTWHFPQSWGGCPKMKPQVMAFFPWRPGRQHAAMQRIQDLPGWATPVELRTS